MLAVKVEVVIPRKWLLKMKNKSGYCNGRDPVRPSFSLSLSPKVYLYVRYIITIYVHEYENIYIHKYDIHAYDIRMAI